MHFQCENTRKKLFWCQINRSRVLLSFPSCDWLHSSNHGAYYNLKKLEHQSKQPVAQNTCNALLIYDICECFLQGSCGYLLSKSTIFTGKNIPCISQGMKKPAYYRFVKIFENYVPLCISFGIMQSEVNCQIVHPTVHNSRSPVIEKIKPQPAESAVLKISVSFSKYIPTSWYIY